MWRPTGRPAWSVAAVTALRFDANPGDVSPDWPSLRLRALLHDLDADVLLVGHTHDPWCLNLNDVSKHPTERTWRPMVANPVRVLPTWAGLRQGNPSLGGGCARKATVARWKAWAPTGSTAVW